MLLIKIKNIIEAFLECQVRGQFGYCFGYGTSKTRNIVIFLALFGPGIITGSVDNDAGGITTYSVAGAIYGYRMIWTLIPSLIVLLIIQEMNARMGIVTGKGLSDLIRENAGFKITFFINLFSSSNLFWSCSGFSELE